MLLKLSVLFGVVALVGLPTLVFRAAKWWFPLVKFRGTTTRKVIALTIDDAPYGTGFPSTSGIVAALKYNRVKATFFVISDYVGAVNMGLLVHMVRHGHELANHGKTNSLHALKGWAQLHYETAHCLRTLKYIYHKANATLRSGTYYRPGGGIPTQAIAGFTTVLASTYPFDPIIRWPRLNFWILKAYTAPGAIVVLHDRAWTPELLDLYLPWLKKNGYECILLSEMLALDED